MPTKFGLKKPGEAYLQHVKLFDDLPTVVSCQGVKEKFLTAIGVRRTVELDTIFARLLAAGGDNKQRGARHMELIKYLASVRDQIPAEDLKRLRDTPICPAEADPSGIESSQGTLQLYKVSDLYEPKDQYRGLGLPILQWLGPPGSYKASSNEGRFLSVLGIKPFPDAPELVKMMASKEDRVRDKAMAYFMTNFHTNSYSAAAISQTKQCIMPIQNNEKRLVAPSQCFTNEHCSVFGFEILRRDLHPHASVCLRLHDYLDTADEL